MPLQIEQEVEPPEVAALKAKVVEVAEKYATRHGWCHVYMDALKEMGVVGGTQKIGVQVRFTVAGVEQEAVRKFEVSALAGKSDEEQRSWVAEQITPGSIRVAGKDVTIPVEVLDLNPAPVTPGASLDDVPEGYIAFYTSNEGRVAHLAQAPQRVTDGRTSAEDWLNSRPIYAMCGVGGYGGVTQSARSENRLCAKCVGRT